MIADLDPGLAATGCASLKAKGLNAEIVIMDVTDSNRVSRSPMTWRRVTAALISSSIMPALREAKTLKAEQVSDEHWLNVIDVNLNGTFWCCRAFGKHAGRQVEGSIVNIGSMSGFIVNKPQEQCYYNASKAAVHHLTKSLAAEWGARGVLQSCRSARRRRPLTHSSKAIRGCTMPGSAVRRWPRWGGRWKLPPSSCLQHPTPQA